MISITVVLLSIAIFAALVINMALKPSYSAKLTAVLILLSACGGSVIYGLGYTYVTKDIALSLIRTPFSVIGMYLGKNDLSAISGAPVVSTSAGIICFWALHLFAFYSIASAAIITSSRGSQNRAIPGARKFLTPGKMLYQSLNRGE